MNRYFLLLNFLGFSYLFWVSRLIGRTFETNTFPVTYKVLEVFQGTFGLFFFAIIVLFGAEALWRDRDVKVDGITGTFPVSTAHYLSAKAAALFTTLALLSSAMMLGGILVQKMRGYFHHEIGLYAINLFGLGFVDFALIVALTFMVFSLVRNKYQGYAVMGAYYVFDNFAANALLQHKLLIFGAAPSLVYSDLNGFGPNVFPYLVFKIFWCLVALCLVRVSVWVWQRSDGERAPLQKIIKEKIAQTPRRSFALAGSIVACASFILYNTLILNTFVTASGAEKKQARYEKTYGQFVAESQPDIDQLSMALEIEPDCARVHGKISAWLTNNSPSTIDQLHLEFDYERIHNVKFDREAKLVVTDIELGVFRWALTKPLLPGERIAVSFIVDDYQVGFANNGRNTEVVDNGTFYQPPIPKVGYQPSQEITDGRRRKAFDLKEKPDFISRDSEGVETRSFLGLEQSFIELDITLGTTLDQRAFAPGDLVNEWRKSGRAYFKYVSQQKVLNFISIVSGRYAHSQLTWMAEGNMHHPVELSVYHHPKHNANTDAMLEASEMAMDDFTRRFGPYPYNQLRILEFPRYADFAQSFAANIPFSESIGFIADVSGIENNVGTDFSDATIDYPFFVTAHEIAHQWWAHQLSAADAEGANFLIESMSQYSALRVYERKYGASGVRKLLRYYSNNYGIERTVARTGSRERPLLRVRNGQGFVHYAKGISALYAVSEQIGEVTFDAAVKEFLKNFSYKNRQYPTTQDFMDTLLSYADVNTHDYINEQLEQITLMSYNVEMPTYHRLSDFSYKITASIEFKKQFQLDDGTLIEAASETLVDVGFYNANGEEIDVVQLPLTNGQNKVEVKLPRKPSTLVIEPYFKWQELNVIKEEITLLPSGT